MTTTTDARKRPGAQARTERRLLVQLSVAAVSMATLAASWLGIAGAERAVTQPSSGSGTVLTNAGTVTGLAPAPASSDANVVRRSRAS
ncbi:MAG: hypothetical protein R3B59_01315 [Dehalococcoidia bacterium]